MTCKWTTIYCLRDCLKHFMCHTIQNRTDNSFPIIIWQRLCCNKKLLHYQYHSFRLAILFRCCSRNLMSNLHIKETSLLQSILVLDPKHQETSSYIHLVQVFLVEKFHCCKAVLSDNCCLLCGCRDDPRKTTTVRESNNSSWQNLPVVNMSHSVQQTSFPSS